MNSFGLVVSYCKSITQVWKPGGSKVANDGIKCCRRVIFNGIGLVPAETLVQGMSLNQDPISIRGTRQNMTPKKSNQSLALSLRSYR